MRLYGEEIEKKEFLKKIGDMSMLADAREGILTSGKGDGVRIIDIKTGGGLEFTVLPTRGMDIAWAEYKGIPLSYISKTGVVHPSYFEARGDAFLRNFFCGLVTTCGLTSFGTPEKDGAEELGLHGRISNTPAEDVCVDKEWNGNDYTIKARGKIKESCVFKENLCLTREITTGLGKKSFVIKDIVENKGYDESPFMLLYHINLGYPVVSRESVLLTPEGTSVCARDDVGEVEKYNVFQEPEHGYKEQVFYLDIPAVKDNCSYAAIFNRKLNLGVYVKFDREAFTNFSEWKMMGEGEYVVGMEPATARPEGRKKARENGELIMLKPEEKKVYTFEIGVFEDEKSLGGI
ncbi:MAG TPA: DUF4432 domain-containing protein [Lachnospiraceae bacterium]|jgi:hypothetical protein|nr:DUF4432 domain-containing protein [Lachnospiraceae bacterium]